MRLRATAVLSLLAASALVAGTRSGEPSFSRSRWIASRPASLRFDGGALPATREGLAALLAEGAAGKPAPPLRPGPPNVRVSQDILPADGGADQPETEAEPSFALHPTNERIQLAGYQENRFADGGARALIAVLSQDGGRTWDEQLLPGLTQAGGGPWERASDPWVAYGPDGRAYYASIGFFENDPRNAVLVSVSADGGQSWAPPATVHAVANGDFDDKEAVVVDGSPRSPHRGRLYVGWDTVTTDNHQILRVAHSDDGASWSSPQDVYAVGANLGCLPLVGPDGTVYLVWVSYRSLNGPAPILVSRSTDGGDTWSAATTVGSETAHGVTGMRTGGGLPAAAIDPRTGTLYVVWTDDRFTPGTDQIVVASSRDGGATWRAPQRVSDGPNDAPAFTPAVAVTAQGQVGVAYSTLRNDPGRSFLVDQYLTLTNGRGVFQGSRRMSTRSFDARFAAIADGYFLGDYQGLAAGRTGFKPLWIATAAPSALDPRRNQPDAYTLAAGRR